MSTGTDEFWRLKIERDQIAETVRKKVRLIEEAAETLAGTVYHGSGSAWHWTLIEGFGTYPTEVVRAQRHAKPWPTAQEIADLLTTWHKADQAFIAAWKALSPVEKEQFSSHKPPEWTAPEKKNRL